MINKDSIPQSNLLSFTPDTLMADIILANYRLIPIIGRFNISFGFKNSTTKEVCDHYGIDVNFFLEIINYYHRREEFPAKALQGYSCQIIVTYLKDTHNYYRRIRLPKVQKLINKMLAQLTDEDQFNVNLLGQFYQNYKSELENHLNKEEQIVFPYAVSLEQAVDNTVIEDAKQSHIEAIATEQYKDHHVEMEITLSDLKNLIIRYLSATNCDLLSQNLLMELCSLEEDLQYHSLIEERVLIPKIKLLEQQIVQ